MTTEKISLLAGLLWAFLPLALIEAKVAKPDPLMVCLVLFSTYSLMSQNKHRYVWTGLLIGLAASAKYQAAALILPTVFYLCLDQNEPKKITQFILLGLTSLFGFLAGSPYVLLDFPTFYLQFSQQSKIMTAGMTGLEGGPKGWMLYLQTILRPEENFILGFLLILGGVIGFVQRKKEVLYCALTILMFYLLLGRMRVIGTHYFYIGMPYLIILGMVGMKWLTQQFEQKKWSALPLQIISVGLVGIYIGQIVPLLKKLSHKDTRILAYEWITKNIPENSSILSDASGPNLPMSRSQLTKLYEHAKEMGHVKADLFKLQLEAASTPSYNVIITEQSMMMTPPELLNYSRQVQDLIPIENGVAWVKAQGVQYVVSSEYEWSAYQSGAGKLKYPAQAQFYEDLQKGTSTQIEFNPIQTKGPGPHLIIYKLS